MENAILNGEFSNYVVKLIPGGEAFLTAASTFFRFIFG
jgi:hypothetical protein